MYGFHDSFLRPNSTKQYKTSKQQLVVVGSNLCHAKTKGSQDFRQKCQKTSDNHGEN